MTAEEIRSYVASKSDSQAALLFCLREIAAQLAEQNELARESQVLARKQLEILQKDFEMRSDPARHVAEMKKAFEQMISGAVNTTELPRNDPPPAPAPQFPRRGRH